MLICGICGSNCVKDNRPTINATFSSDNGGLHVPEGGHARVTHNTPFRAGKRFLYEGGLRVPLLVRWPGRISPGAVIDAPVINTNWIPTLLELIGRPAPTGLDGMSFAKLLTEGGAAPRRTFFWHFPHYNNQGGRPGGAMREGDWKLVEYFDAPDAPELYHVSNDIAESRNLAAGNVDRVRTMRAALASWRESVNAQSNTPNPNFNPESYRANYIDFDAGRFDPARAGDAEWAAIQTWRTRMNAAVRSSTNARSAR